MELLAASSGHYDASSGEDEAASMTAAAFLEPLAASSGDQDASSGHDDAASMTALAAAVDVAAGKIVGLAQFSGELSHESGTKVSLHALK